MSQILFYKMIFKARALHRSLTGLRAWVSFGVFFFSSIVFGFWFKARQIAIASEDILNYYPLSGYSWALLQTACLFGVLWAGVAFICSATQLVGVNKMRSKDILFWSVLPLTSFVLCVFNVGLPMQVLWFLVLSGVLIGSMIFKNPLIFNKITEPICVLILYVLVFVFACKGFSPWYLEEFFQWPGNSGFFVSMEHQWENAKAYDFLGYFSQKERLGGLPLGVYLVSELSSFLVLLFDVPIADVYAKYNPIRHIFFGLYIFGSYGCFLFIRYGLKLSLVPSLVGGLGFVLGNAQFLSFLGAEYSIHQIQFLFFPWVLLLIKCAYSFNRPIFLCFAGMVASLSEYAMSSHPEMDMLYFGFCNLYNLYLAFLQFGKEDISIKLTGRLLFFVAAYPVFHWIGLSYRLIPLVDSILAKEFLPLDSATGAGLGWNSSPNNLIAMFFRYEGLARTGAWNSQISASATLYGGQFLILMNFYFFAGLFIYDFKKIFRKESPDGASLHLTRSLFFFGTFIFLAINLPLGAGSLLDHIFKATGFLRLHGPHRILVYFWFFALMTGVFGLEYLISLKRKTHHIYICSAYLLIGIVMFLVWPSRPGFPDKILFDTMILSGLIVLIFFQNYNFWPNTLVIRFMRFAKLIRFLMLTLLVCLALFSLMTAQSNIYNDYISRSVNIHFTGEKAFKSLRSSYVYLKNNPHDQASIDYFNEEIEVFFRKSEVMRAKKHMSDEEFFRNRELYSQHLGKESLFEVFAPIVDNFNMYSGEKYLAFRSTSMSGGGWPYDNYSGVQYYFPDNYHLLTVFRSSMLAPFAPLGKFSEIFSRMVIGAGPSYPSADISFHMKFLYDKRFYSNPYFDYMVNNLPIENIVENPFSEKILNLIGVDYVLYHKHYVDTFPQDYQDRIFAALEQKGFIKVEFPESYRFSVVGSGAPEFVKMVAYKNTRSFGKAYVAKWVDFIRPDENKLNLSIFDISHPWATSTELMENFGQNLSKIPDNIWRSAIIETLDKESLKASPEISQENSEIEVLKIIASKAVFDVDCKEETCWLVYNTAALKGWEAYDGAKQLSVHQANLGFIGVNLDKGRHFVWMEYNPGAPVAGLLVTCMGWIFVFYRFILWFGKPSSRASESPAF